MPQRFHWIRRVLVAVPAFAIAACGVAPSGSPSTPRPPEVTINVATTPAATSGASGDPLAPTPSAPAATPAVGPSNFPAGVNPLTGLAVADPSLLDRRPLAIKVANSPRSIREKQFSLNLADLVFEHIAEGGNTRFTAIFLGNDSAQVGPVRSARLIDLELTAMYKSVFGFSGSSGGTREKFIVSDVALQMFSEVRNQLCPPFCRYDPDNWNLLMVDTAALEALALSRGVSGGRQNLDGLKFDPAVPAGGESATTVQVRFGIETWNEWRYDSFAGRYLRWADTSATELEPLHDALSGEIVSAANVAVAYVPTYQTDILEDDEGFDPTTGAGGHYGVQIQLWGSGPAIVFRDGQAYRGSWVRLVDVDGRGATLGFVDANNNPIALKPGNTWVEIIGGLSESTTYSGTWAFTHKQP